MEILRQHQGPIDAVFVAIGGGGLISGVAAYIKAVRPEIKVIGVQTADSDAMVRSVAAGERVTLGDVGLFSDGTAVKLVGEETFRLARELVDDFVVVDTDAVCAAIKDVFEDTRSILEPAGALARRRDQAVRRGDTALRADAGRDHVRREHELRPPAVRRRAGRGRRGARGAVRGHDPRGARQLPALLRARSAHAQRHRVQLPHLRRAARPTCSSAWPRRPRRVAAASPRDFAEHGFAALDLTDDELAKEHVRHMVGGRSRLAHDERLYRFVFPERPGALMRFLSSMHPDWNISLFHYRNQGADYGRILVGIQVPADEDAEFRAFLETLAYPCVDETDNPVYRLFLRLADSRNASA